jgi:hypothetical protein
MYDLFYILSLWLTYGSMECVCVCMYVCMCVYVCIYVCVYVCVYLCVYVYISELNREQL